MVCHTELALASNGYWIGDAIFITGLLYLYEITHQTLDSETNDLRSLHTEGFLRRPARFMHTPVLCTDCSGGRRLGLYADHDEIVSVSY